MTSNRTNEGARLEGPQLELLIERITDRVMDRLTGCSRQRDWNPTLAETASVSAVAASIDHTLLAPEATPSEIETLCHEAVEHGFASVCVNSSWVSHVSRVLGNAPVKTCTTVGFPLGAASTESKAREAEQAVADGAQEVDMVLAVGWLKGGHHTYVAHDIGAVVAACGHRAIVKVILETCLLTEEEKRLACRISTESGAHFVKTSTGFGAQGATLEDVRLMAQESGKSVGVKASGGIQTYEQAVALLEAGATRLGTSRGVAIIRGASSTSGTRVSDGGSSY